MVLNFQGVINLENGVRDRKELKAGKLLLF